MSSLGDRRPRSIVEVGLRRRLGRRVRPLLDHANDSRRLVERRVVGRGRRRPRSSAVVARATIGPHGSSWLDDDLAPLHQLEHREERDRDDDPVADAAQQVLEHDRAGAARAPRG